MNITHPGVHIGKNTNWLTSYNKCKRLSPLHYAAVSLPPTLIMTNYLFWIWFFLNLWCFTQEIQQNPLSRLDHIQNTSLVLVMCGLTNTIFFLKHACEAAQVMT